MAKAPLDPKRCATLLAALAAPERLKIVRCLVGGKRTVTELAEHLGIKPLNVTHHLSVLRNAGLIRGVKRGRFVDYALTPGVLDEVVDTGIPRAVLNLRCCRFDFPAEREPSTPNG